MLIICDGCGRHFHFRCVGLEYVEGAEFDWYCGDKECQENFQAFLTAEASRKRRPAAAQPAEEKRPRLEVSKEARELLEQIKRNLEKPDEKYRSLKAAVVEKKAGDDASLRYLNAELVKMGFVKGEGGTHYIHSSIR